MPNLRKALNVTSHFKASSLKSIFFIIYTFCISSYVFGQQTDTLRFYSNVFKSERTVYITTPEFYKYQSKEVKLPVVFLLDGQHEWFVNPVLNTIRYLQYTHQIPHCIVVTIPLVNRNKECGIKNLEGDELPLYKFITEEIDEKIKLYQVNKYKLLIGHSFSASFSLYAYFKNPNYFSAVIANTPLDNFKELILAIDSNDNIDKQRIYISVGGNAKHEDYFHRKAFDKLEKEFPAFFNSIHTFVAKSAGHNAVPILATPNLLTKLFSEFSKRYTDIASVDDNYMIIDKPSSIEDEIYKIETASKIVGNFYPPEIADLNGLASRYWNSNLINYAIAIYELGTKYYPGYYDFHLQLYELLLETDLERAKLNLNKGNDLLKTVETNNSARDEIMEEIAKEMKKNGW